jgi:hypothetical protein
MIRLVAAREHDAGGVIEPYSTCSHRALAYRPKGSNPSLYQWTVDTDQKLIEFVILIFRAAFPFVRTFFSETGC